MIVDTNDAILLVGAGPVGKVILSKAATMTRLIVAADGGANHLLRGGLMPSAVIGDLDSLTPKTRAALPSHLLHHVTSQATTDLEKCLDAIRAPLIIGLGFLDGRTDHVLAALNAIVARPSQSVILVGQHDICFLARANQQLDLPFGSRLSLFPMRGISGESAGLEWPVNGLSFAPDGQIGTSNRVTGPVRLDFPKPGMIVILPQSALAEVVRSLRAPPASRGG